jgi:hypothetical protein
LQLTAARSTLASPFATNCFAVATTWSKFCREVGFAASIDENNAEPDGVDAAKDIDKHC